MGKQTVYGQMISSPAGLFGVLRAETGIKTDCLPFAQKAIAALKSLGGLTETEALKVAHTFLDNMQTLMQGGIIAEDYDKIDMVKRGKVITLSARVELLLRAAARKGYRVIQTIIAVPVEDGSTTYFKEHFYDGEIVYILEDGRLQGDRIITAKRLISSYFSKFLCRLEVTDTKQNRRVMMTICEMSNEEVLNASMASDNGIYKTKWETFLDDRGYEKRRKVVLEEPNSGSIWNTWTSEMVTKTIMRRALKRVREVLPELKDTIYAFDNDNIYEGQEKEAPRVPKEIAIPLKAVNVDLDNLTAGQTEETDEMFELFSANPKMAADKANEIMRLFNGSNARELINTHYASIVNIRKSKKLYPIIAPLLDGANNKQNSNTGAADEKQNGDEGGVTEKQKGENKRENILECVECGKEIKSEKSKKYYAEHSSVPPKCFSCNNKGRVGA